jgi:hypothetical protein
VEKPKPIDEYIKLMRKFSHLDEADIEEFQRVVEERFEQTKALAKMA